MQELEKRLEYYAGNLVLIWLAVFIYRTNKYYLGYLKPETQQILLWLAIGYSGVMLLYYLLMPAKHLHESKGAAAFRIIWRSLKDFRLYLRNISDNPPFLKITPEERTTLLFLLVKLFFIPVMLNFAVGNVTSLFRQFAYWQNSAFAIGIESYNGLIYPLLITLLFSVDTLWFSFGYLFEFSWLGNKVRSVEPTLFGWVVALACYPPFNGVTGYFITSYNNDYSAFPSEVSTFVLRIALILLYGIFVWATIALGTKCSNLTNRGIVGSGPYAFVRHPAYASKVLAWFVTLLPVIDFRNFQMLIFIVLGSSAWAVVYYLRAITEERHLIRDPDYQAYCKKVKYRFIPFVF